MKIFTLIQNQHEEASFTPCASYRGALIEVAEEYGMDYDENLDDAALEAFVRENAGSDFEIAESELIFDHSMTFGDYAVSAPAGDKVEVARADGSRVRVPAQLIERGIMDAIDAGGEEVEVVAEEDPASQPALKRYFVHRYDVIRIKIAVEAADQKDAMKRADEFLSQNYPLRDWSTNPSVQEDVEQVSSPYANLPLALAYEHAEETTGYLVDELGDDEYDNSVQYDHNMQLADGNPARVATIGEDDGSIVLTFGPCSMPENVSDPEECFASMAVTLEERLNGEAYEIIKELAEENGFTNDDENDEEEED